MEEFLLLEFLPAKKVTRIVLLSILIFSSIFASLYQLLMLVKMAPVFGNYLSCISFRVKMVVFRSTYFWRNALLLGIAFAVFVMCITYSLRDG